MQQKMIGLHREGKQRGLKKKTKVRRARFWELLAKIHRWKNEGRLRGRAKLAIRSDDGWAGVGNGRRRMGCAREGKAKNVSRRKKK